MMVPNFTIKAFLWRLYYKIFKGRKIPLFNDYEEGRQ